jgi:hypothetical protein
VAWSKYLQRKKMVDGNLHTVVKKYVSIMSR